MTVRTRFAPSPTGHLHIGGARTALFNWLYARRHEGVFVLRIEDSDRERSTTQSADEILAAMRWLGLDWDREPVYQSTRFAHYREHAERLLEQGKAYHCWCSSEELEAMRNAQRAQGLKPRYDRRCFRDPKPRPGVTPVIRFLNPDSGEVVVSDLIRGELVFSNGELDDLVILRSDGTPTYNFSVVIDDAEAEITHVIRGDDHINNTPRQINVAAALGLPCPQYAHTPMILGADGSRLSKRHGALGVLEYRDAGYLPQAMLNYLVRLGWSHGDQEVFTPKELTQLFDLEHVNKAPASFDPAKLLWLNQQWIKTLPTVELATALGAAMAARGIDPATGPSLESLALAQRERGRTLCEIAAASEYFYRDFAAYAPKAEKQHLSAAALPALESLHAALGALGSWEEATTQAAVQEVAETLGVGLGKVAQPLRVALTGDAVSPGIGVTLALLGRERTLERLRRAIDHVRQRDA